MENVFFMIVCFSHITRVYQINWEVTLTGDTFFKNNYKLLNRANIR